MTNEMDKPDDPVAMYRREVANVTSLTDEEEKELFRQLRSAEDGSDAQEALTRRLIEHNLYLVLPVAERNAAGTGIALLDLLQEGNIGLMKALDSFGPKPSGGFKAYAVSCIEKAISEFLESRNKGEPEDG